MRTPLVAANWKMNGSRQFNQALLAGVVAGARQCADVELAICPPHVYIEQARAALASTDIGLGAQNLSEHDDGAFTGEVSARMLSDMECRYVLVGHSERRTLFGETDEMVSAKFRQSQMYALQPVLCVGETLEDRDAGRTEEVIAAQLDAVLGVAGVFTLTAAVIAYEPVWAIGTGHSASPEQAQAVHAFIRERVARQDGTIARRLRIIYGGSVKPDSAAELFAMEDIDGGLIGGASLKADDFLAIARAASATRT